MTEQGAPGRPIDKTEAPSENGNQTGASANAVEQAEAIVAKAVIVEPIGAATGGAGRFPSRETLDREMRQIKDEVLRMGSLVAVADRRRNRRARHSRRREGDRRDRRRRPHQRGAAPHRLAHHDDHRHAATGRARPALPALARPRDLRARADGRPCRVGRQAGAQARAAPAAERATSTCRAWARLAADQVRGVLRALVDLDTDDGPRGCGARRRHG